MTQESWDVTCHERSEPPYLLPDVLDVDQGRDGADLGVLRAL